MTDVAIRALVRGALEAHRLAHIDVAYAEACTCGHRVRIGTDAARSRHLEDVIVDALAGRTEVCMCGHARGDHYENVGPCYAGDGSCLCGIFAAVPQEAPMCGTCWHPEEVHASPRGPCQAVRPDGTADGRCPCGTYRADLAPCTTCGHGQHVHVASLGLCQAQHRDAAPGWFCPCDGYRAGES